MSKVNRSQEILDAVRQGSYQKVCTQIRECVTSGQEQESMDSEDCSAILLESLYRNKPEITRLLLATRARLNIFESSALGYLERLQCLLECDRDLVNHFSPDGFTALHLACFFGHLGIAETLIKEGATVSLRAKNPMSVMPLHSAVAANREKIVVLLLSSGADPNAKQQGGFTPLMGAASNGNEAIFTLLFQHGADPEVIADSGQNAADIAKSRGNQGILNCLESLR